MPRNLKASKEIPTTQNPTNKGSADKYERIRSYQLGIWATGQEEAVTPVFLPVSTGRLDTLDKGEIARLLPCPPEHLEVIVSPFSVLFGTEHHIVCAYDAGPNGLMYPTGPEPGIPFSNAPGDLCTHAVHMTRSLVHSFGSQINGNAIFFYLKRGKHLLAKKDFRAVKAFIKAWDEGDANCTKNALKKFAKVFHAILKEEEEKEKEEKLENAESGVKIEEFDIAVFPALDEKPFVIKYPFAKIPPEELYCGHHHPVSREDILGDGFIEQVYVRQTPKLENLDNILRIYLRSFLMREGGFCPISLSIARATNRTAVIPWSGNMIVVRESERNSEWCEDITDQDIDVAITYFSHYGRR